MSTHLAPTGTSAAPLIGRDDVLAAARPLLAHPNARLITITGPAGVGKTRIATELLRIHGAPSGPEVVSISLDTLDDPNELDAELARAAGISVVAGESIGDAVVRWLEGRKALVLLDNAEHLLGISPRVAAWLAAAPELRVIVTSRQRLNLTIETELELQPLGTRQGHSDGRLSPAAELFARMAGCDSPDRLPADVQAALERLATRLEGLPLAIELVAARVTRLDREHIDDLVDSTDAMARSLPAVASALDVAVARSYDLLTVPARAVLRHLTVFSGGFTTELVERLIDRAPALEPAADRVADVLDELSAHHLVQVQSDTRHSPRFTILTMVSEAVGRLREEHGETDAAREAHARALLDFASAREYAGFWPGHEHEIAELAVSFHNIMAAIDWLHEQRDVDGLVRIVGALTWFWYSQGHYAHGLFQYDRVLELDPRRDGRDWARFQLGRGVLLDLMGRFEDARDAMLSSLDAYAAAGSIDGAAVASIGIGFNAFHLGRFDDAQESLDRAIRHARAIPERDLGNALEAVALANIGANAQERGDAITAEVSLRRAVDIHESMHLQWGAGRGLCDLGGVLRDAGKHAEALTTYQRALEPALSISDHRLIAVALAGIATVITHDDQYHLGAWMFGGVAALRPIAGTPSFLRANEAAWQRAREAARSTLGAGAFSRAWGVGARAPLNVIVGIARNASLLGPDPFPPVDQRLTRQERSVLRMIIQDLTTTMIGELLGITDRTVNSHLNAIFRKYGVNSRLELLALVSHHRGHRPDA